MCSASGFWAIASYVTLRNLLWLGRSRFNSCFLQRSSRYCIEADVRVWWWLLLPVQNPFQSLIISPFRVHTAQLFQKGERKKKKLAPFMSHCRKMKKTAALQIFNWKLPIWSVNMFLTTCKILWNRAITIRYIVQAFFKLQKCRFHSQSGKPERADVLLLNITHYRIFKSC